MNIIDLTEKYGKKNLNRVYDRFYSNGEVWMAEYIITHLSPEDLEFYMEKHAYEVIKTDEGFMAYNRTLDEYLENEKGDNTFDTEEEAENLINEDIKK